MKVLLVATVQSHICQFHKPLVRMLHAHGCEVHVAAHDNLAVKNGLKLDFVEKVFEVPFERSPFSIRNIAAYRQLREIINTENYDVIHCNTPVGGIVGRLAALHARKRGTKVIYTAHGFHFFQGGPKKSWLVFYPIEKIMSRFTDAMILINKEDYLLAQKKFSCRVFHTHGVGVSSERYHPMVVSDIEKRRMEMGYGEYKYLLLCTGELNENKDQTTIIKAMPGIVSTVGSVKLLLAGNGPKEQELKRLVKSLGLDNHVEFLGYRTDLERFTPIVDVVVSCSHREGMPLNIIEAMLCAKPVVASINRGHKELVENEGNGYLLMTNDVDGFATNVVCLLKNKDLREQLGKNGYQKSLLYSDSFVYTELENIYNYGK